MGDMNYKSTNMTKDRDIFTCCIHITITGTKGGSKKKKKKKKKENTKSNKGCVTLWPCH